MLNAGNQIHYFIYTSGSGTVINFGSGSNFLTSYNSGCADQKVTVPVPQHRVKVWTLTTGVPEPWPRHHCLPSAPHWQHNMQWHWTRWEGCRRCLQRPEPKDIDQLLTDDKDKLRVKHFFEGKKRGKKFQITKDVVRNTRGLK